MAYATGSMNLIVPPVAGIAPKIYGYYQTTDNNATIVGAGYVSDGASKGMKVGDLVLSTNATQTTTYVVTAVGAATATLTAAVAIS